MAGSISSGGTSQTCRDNVPRRLIVQDQEFHPDALLRVRNMASFSGEQAGRMVAQPDPAATTRGDIRPTLSGVPETDETGGTIVVTKAGVDGRARWAWVRSEDSAASDLQIRQSPMVFGRRVDVIDRNTVAGQNAYFIRPKALPLASGALLCAWIRSTHVPANVQTGGAVYKARLGTAVSQSLWDQTVGVSLLVGRHGTNDLVGWDMVQYPDTGEIVGVAAEYLLGAPTLRYLYCYHSPDDGTTWYERSRSFFEGSPRDITLIESGFNDSSELQHCSLELTDGGRLVCILATREALWSLVSDDRGMSWTASLITRWTVGNDNQPVPSLAEYGAGTSIGKTRQGLLVAWVAHPHSDAWYVMAGFASVDGINWGSRIDFGFNGLNGRPGTLDPAFVTRPDGWPMLYASVHQIRASGAWHGWIMARSFLKRDITLADDEYTLFPLPVGSYQMLGFHIPETAPAGDLLTSGGVKTFGFSGNDAVVWHGQVVILACITRESAADVFAEGAVGLYRTFHFQPLQERLVQVPSVPAFPANGYVYNRVWDCCFGIPSAWGFVAAGAGSSQIVTVASASTTGGSLQINTTPPQTLSYADTTLPSPHATISGVVRAFVRIIEGGSVTGDYIALKLKLDNGVNGISVSVRFERTGTNVKLALYDNVAGADITGTAPTYSMAAGDHWLEVLLAVGESTPAVYLFSRAHVPETDPHFDKGYDQVNTNTPLTTAAVSAGVQDDLEFGHLAAFTADCISQWKGVHLHRGPAVVSLPLRQLSSSFVDIDSEQVASTQGEPWALADLGVRNFPRTSQITSVPDQEFQRGLAASWRGEATALTTLTYAAAFKYPGRSLLDLSSKQEEWRSISDDVTVELVFDAARGGTRPGATFRPSAIGVIGRNWCSARLQFNATDAWGAPSIDIGLGVPGTTGGTMTRTTHILNFTTSGGYGVVGGDYRARIFTPAGNTDILRPHRFASKPDGPRYYAVFPDNPSNGTHLMLRIVDNDGNTLHFASSPSGVPGFKDPADMVIISDRFAYEFGHLNPTDTELGYRYCRLVIEPCYHWDTDERFYRTGLIVLGHGTAIDPGIVYGYTMSHDAGSDLAYEERGIGHRVRNHSPRMSWALDGPPLRSGAEMSAPANTPYRELRSWPKLLDLTRRLEANGEPAMLVFDGPRYLGDAAEDEEPVAADPLDLTMVRVQSIGEVGHLGYDTALMSTAPEPTGWPRPVAQVRRIVLVEDL